MKTTKRVLAMLLCLIMALSLLPMVASAASSPVIDTTQKGTLTIHKFEYNGTDTPAGNGVEGSQRVPYEAVALQGVEFSIYKIKDVNELKEYYSGVQLWRRSRTNSLATGCGGEPADRGSVRSHGFHPRPGFRLAETRGVTHESL